MAQQTKLLMYAQERYDLPDKNNLQDLMEDDFQLLQKALIGGTNTLVIKGFSVTSIPPLGVTIAIAGSVLFHGGYNGELYVGPVGAPALSALATDGATTYFYLTLSTVDGTPAIRTFWDPSLFDGAGGEFNQSVNTHQDLTVTLQNNNVGFPVGANVIPICKTIAAVGVITTFTDSRNMLFRLGTGGNTPDLDHVYPWSAGRAEPGVTGATVAIFSGGDKQLVTLKDDLDAIKSNIKEMKFGSAIGAGAVWYAPTPGTLSDGELAMTGGGVFNWNLGLNQLSFTADITFLIPGTAFTNTIAVASSPITLDANDKVAYIDLDRTGNTVLPVTVTTSTAFVDQIDRFIVARRITNAAYIGF